MLNHHFPMVFPWFSHGSRPFFEQQRPQKNSAPQAASDGSLTPAEVLALKMSFEDIDKTRGGGGASGRWGYCRYHGWMAYPLVMSK
jgi:hypothetical protein